MEQFDFTTSFQVKETPTQVIKKIEAVNDWWATNVFGNTTHLRDVFTVRFGKTFATMQVAEFIEDKKIKWTIRESSLPLFKNEKVWNGTDIVWDILLLSNIT